MSAVQNLRDYAKALLDPGTSAKKIQMAADKLKNDDFEVVETNPDDEWARPRVESFHNVGLWERLKLAPGDKIHAHFKKSSIEESGNLVERLSIVTLGKHSKPILMYSSRIVDPVSGKCGMIVSSRERESLDVFVGSDKSIRDLMSLSLYDTPISSAIAKCSVRLGFTAYRVGFAAYELNRAVRSLKPRLYSTVKAAQFRS